MSQVTSIHPAPSRIMEPGPLSDGSRQGTLRDFITLAKLGITVSNLLTVFTGMWLASDGYLSFRLVFFTLVGTALVIASGCYLNNYIDRDLDRHMPRTQSRPLPNGRVGAKTVLWTGLGLGIVGAAILLLLVNPFSCLLSLVGLFVYVVIYTIWLKRTSTLNTVIGGISGAVPPLIGWAAVTGSLNLTAWVLFIIMFLWQPPHFLALAMRRVEDYRAGGIPMLPVVRGFEVTKHQMLRYVAALVPASLLLYGLQVVGALYLVVAIVLSVVYLVLSIKGLFAKDDMYWAKGMFKYSLVYMMVLFIAMIVSVHP